MWSRYWLDTSCDQGKMIDELNFQLMFDIVRPEDDPGLIAYDNEWRKCCCTNTSDVCEMIESGINGSIGHLGSQIGKLSMVVWDQWIHRSSWLTDWQVVNGSLGSVDP
ncbi:hypothetical protein RRG08_037167 [Elysia crispata]|uniref:Uncharacterized protein n=1 Tax=Elysia crispata TaxID=231223 RepID=A0AAE0Z3B6_9GAST|nr:hypothetical protein RRG08_037167 [Elysia crispata]